MDQGVTAVLSFLHGYSGDSISVLVLILSLVSLLLVWRFLGVLGLYVFQVVALLSANIQVLRMGTTVLSSEPVALGTIVFATTYVAEDLINQQSGPRAARLGIYIGLMAQLLFSVFMLSALAYQPQPNEYAYEAMSFLFVPSLRLLAASLVAYGLSHLFNVQCFAYLRRVFGSYPLWLRVSCCGWFATIIDHFIFSYLAWRLLAPLPVTWSALWLSYILPSLAPRIVVAFLVSPAVLWAQKSRV